jgi:hypothetical protein
VILFGSILIANRQRKTVQIFLQGNYIICSAILAEQIICGYLRVSAYCNRKPGYWKDRLKEEEIEK